MAGKKAKADVVPVRQQNQYNCMTTSLCMALRALGVPEEECSIQQVNKVVGAMPLRGAAWEPLLAAANHYGMRAILTLPSTVRQLKKWTDAGSPIVIAWNPEGREWSHASLVFDVTEDDEHGFLVHVADPNIPDPDETVRVVPKGEFYQKWYEKSPQGFLIRRPACAIEREITPEGRQVMASMKKSAARRGPPSQVGSSALLKRQGYTPVDVMFGEALPHRRPIVSKGDGIMDRRGDVYLFAGIAGDGSPILAKDERELERLSKKVIEDRLHVVTAAGKDYTVEMRGEADNFRSATSAKRVLARWARTSKTAAELKDIWVVTEPGEDDEIVGIVSQISDPRTLGDLIRGMGRRWDTDLPALHDSQDSAEKDAMRRLEKVHKGDVPDWVLQDKGDYKLASVRRLVQAYTKQSNRFQKRMDRKLKSLINHSFERVGLDGNTRFNTPQQGYSRAVDLMGEYGVELAEVPNSFDFKHRPTGTVRVDVAFTNQEDIFSPYEITNSMLVIQYTELREDVFEVIAYMS